MPQLEDVIKMIESLEKRVETLERRPPRVIVQKPTIPNRPGSDRYLCSGCGQWVSRLTTNHMDVCRNKRPRA